MDLSRRTPQPGDSYCKGDVTIEVQDVLNSQVYFSRFGGPFAHLEYVEQMALAVFHAAVAKETWGRA